MKKLQAQQKKKLELDNQQNPEAKLEAKDILTPQPENVQQPDPQSNLKDDYEWDWKARRYQSYQVTHLFAYALDIHYSLLSDHLSLNDSYAQNIYTAPPSTWVISQLLN